jgi:rod shape determining protein RodA
MVISRYIRQYFNSIDLPLFAAIVAISLFSIINLYGVVGLDSQFFERHIVFIGIGMLLMIILSFFNYRYLKNYSFPSVFLYLLSIFLLFLTFYSQSIRGTNAWIILGNLTFEPSELAKLFLITLMAKYFSQRHIHINQSRHIIASGLYFIIPTALVLNQPDFGSAIILTSIWLGMLLAAGINRKYIFLLIIIGLILSYFFWSFLLAPYQKDRLVSFLDPLDDPHGSGYNIIQSKIAIGSGSFFGRGLGNGSQAGLGFLPEPHNDFIFASTIEQFGLVGASGVLLLVFFIIYRILNVAERANNNFGKLFSVGFVIFLFSHVFISAAVNVGLMPVTGIPFTFLSYGGSHLVSVMIGIGILQSIKRYG